MNLDIKNVKHNFNLHSLQEGDSFYGCPICYYRTCKRDNSWSCVLEYPTCLSRLNIYTVTKEDVKPLTRTALGRKYLLGITNETG